MGPGFNLSVTYPGYPVQEHESDAPAFGYRLKRDAAHIDGLIRDGPDIRRFAREYHAFILERSSFDRDRRWRQPSWRSLDRLALPCAAGPAVSRSAAAIRPTGRRLT